MSRGENFDLIKSGVALGCLLLPAWILKESYYSVQSRVRDLHHVFRSMINCLLQSFGLTTQVRNLSLLSDLEARKISIVHTVLENL